MNRIFDETMIIESLAENKVRLHGMDEPITDLDMSIDDVTYRFGRHYSFDFKLGQKWFADVLSRHVYVLRRALFFSFFDVRKRNCPFGSDIIR